MAHPRTHASIQWSLHQTDQGLRIIEVKWEAGGGEGGSTPPKFVGRRREKSRYSFRLLMGELQEGEKRICWL